MSKRTRKMLGIAKVVSSQLVAKVAPPIPKGWVEVPLDVTTKDDAERISKQFAIIPSQPLTEAELATLKIERTADPEKCPRCHMGFAGGLGWRIDKDRCQGCGYNGQRGAEVAR